MFFEQHSTCTNSNSIGFLQFQVSTYALFVEDVLEVVSDAVIVHEAAASRIHRLTKVLFFSSL